MAWRKWLVRGLVFTIAAGLAVAAVFYQRWTDPEKVRAQVLEQLGRRFTGARVSVESAHFHLFGGITVSEVRMARRDDLDRSDFAYIPELTVHLDKEQLLHGKQLLRKLELDRPRIRVLRGADGRWNLDVLAPPDPSEPVPTIVIHHGTVLIEDRLSSPQTPPIEIKDVNLTILNDPLPVLSIAGSGTSDLGPVQLSANFQRQTYETKGSVEALAIPVGPALIQLLSSYSPELGTHARQLEGVGKLHAELAYNPAAKQHWTQDVRLQLSQGKLVHARLPMTLEQIEASVRWVNGRIPLVKATARAGTARMDLTLRELNAERLRESLEHAAKEIELHIEHLPLTPELFASLPEEMSSLHEIERDYEPRGPVSLDFTLSHEANGSWKKHSLMKLEDVRGEFAKFPILVEHTTGTIEQESASGTPGVVRLALTGRVSLRPVTIQGEIREQSPGELPKDAPKLPSIVHVDVRADNVPMDEKLHAALVPKDQKTSKPYELAHEFKPTGLCDVQAFIRRDGTSRKFANRYVIKFHHAALRYRVFPYPIESVTGTLDVQPEHWEFHDFHGSHKGGEFRGRGQSVPGPNGERIEVFIDGTNLLLDDELKAALQEDLQKTWVKFQPSGRVNFTARVDVPHKDHKPEIDLSLLARGCTIRPDFFKYTIRDVIGKIRYAKHWVILEDLHGRHGASSITLKDGVAYLKEGGGVWVQLGRLQGTPLAPDDELLDAMPPCLTRACRCLQWRDPITLDTKLVIDTKPDNPQPVVYWDGTIGLQHAVLKTGVEISDVTGSIASVGLHDGLQLQGVVGNLVIESATLFKQPVRDLHSRIEVTKEEPEILKLPGLYAHFCSGEVYGPIKVEFGPSIRYELSLTASRVKLEEFARQNAALKSELSGEASAQLYLSGRGDDLDTLKGNGRIDVPKGKIENLPPLVNLLKFLALRLPDRTAFEEAHAEFEVQGQRVHVSRLDLFGNAISLRGQGDLDLTGSNLALDFNADWARLAQVLPPGIKQIPPAISNQLLRIKMRGNVDDPKFHKDFIPLVTDPMKKVWGEFKRDPASNRARANMEQPGM